MNRIWEQNKPLIIVLGSCLLALIVMRPNVLSGGEPPLAGWLWRGWRSEYGELERRKDQLTQQTQAYAPGPGRDRVSYVQSRLETANDILRRQFEHRVRELAFIPYEPFLPPGNDAIDSGDGGEEPGFYFRRQLTRTREQLQLYCSLRSVEVAPDLGLGDYAEGPVPEPARVPELLRQLAAADTFVRLCADHQIDHIRIASHRSRRVLDTGSRRDFLREHPMRVELRAGFEEFAQLLRGMKGRRVGVRAVEINQLEQTVKGVWLDTGSEDGVRRDESYIIFRQPEGRPCDLRYLARVTVTNDPRSPNTPTNRNDPDHPEHPTSWRRRSYARIDGGPVDYDRFDLDPEKADALSGSEYEVERCFGTTGFFRVVDMRVRGRPGRIEDRDDTGIPTAVTPHRVEVTMEVSTFDFDPDMRHITADALDGVAPRPTVRPTEEDPDRPRTREVRTW